MTIDAALVRALCAPWRRYGDFAHSPCASSARSPSGISSWVFNWLLWQLWRAREALQPLSTPAESPNPDDASIWRTPIMQLLLSLPECESITLAQGLWGAQSSKPTTLGVLNAPQLKQELHSGRITSELPKGSSIGKDASGQWATARLKEYPPGLCLALARFP